MNNRDARTPAWNGTVPCELDAEAVDGFMTKVILGVVVIVAVFANLIYRAGEDQSREKGGERGGVEERRVRGDGPP